MTMAKKLKILEVTAFSAGICGVWTRVLAESKLLAKKHEVYVFSSNISRGTDKIEIADSEECIDKVHIRRFKTSASFGQNTFFWNFKKEAMKLRPDIIVAHAYRQYYSTQALKIAQSLKVPCFLVTHAPFLEKKLRGWKLNAAVSLYDFFIGKRILNQYKKVIAITHWEIPYLLKLGIKKEKIVYIPNGIPEDFFKLSIKSHKNKHLLFLGRIAPIKDIETLIRAVSIIKDKSLLLDIVGPAEYKYKSKLVQLIKNLKLERQVHFHPAVYDIKEKLKIIDSHKIFILPSKREGMPQALIEAMARQRVVISSKTDGGKEIVRDGKTGFLFEIGNEKELAKKISLALKARKKISENARESVKKFSWGELIKTVENTCIK